MGNTQKAPKLASWQVDLITAFKAGEALKICHNEDYKNSIFFRSDIFAVIKFGAGIDSSTDPELFKAALDLYQSEPAKIDPLAPYSPQHSINQLSIAEVTPVHVIRSPSVYLLYRDGVVVYVGSSIMVLSRISTHLTSDKDFDSYSFIKVNSTADMYDLESRCIAHFNPEYNAVMSNGPTGGFCSMGGLKIRYGVGKLELKRIIKAHRHNIEVLQFRDEPFYNAIHVEAALNIEMGAE